MLGIIAQGGLELLFVPGVGQQGGQGGAGGQFQVLGLRGDSVRIERFAVGRKQAAGGGMARAGCGDRCRARLMKLFDQQYVR